MSGTTTGDIEGTSKPAETNRNCCLSILSVCLMVVVYIICGAAAFFFIESHHVVVDEEPITKPSQEDIDLDTLRNATVQRLWTLTVELNVFYESNWSQVAEVELQKFQDEIMNYVFVSEYYGNRKESAAARDDASFSSFPATILYCLTLITTIGYGTVSPKSLPGRILTVFYACIGIPLTLCYLATVGDFFSRVTRHGYARLTRRSSTGVPIPLSLTFLFLYLVGGAVVFWWLEDWNFVDAIFFCFASLATIGFGGMLDPHSNCVSLLASSAYILLGMALISTVFNLVQDEIIRRRANRRGYHPPIS